MTWVDWIPAIATSALLTAGLYFFRTLFEASIAKDVQHKLDAKLEKIRSDLRSSEANVKADLQSKQAEILALREGALSGLALRQATLDKRRLQAVENLWSTVVELAPLKRASAIMSVIKFEAAAKRAESDLQVRKAFEIMSKSFGQDKPMPVDAAKERPFLSPLAWALFSAYYAVLGHAFAQLKMLELGFSAPEVLDTGSVRALLKTALPNHATFIDAYDSAAFHHLLDELEVKLLDELKRMLRGTEADEASLSQAARILAAADKVTEEIGRDS